METSCVASGSDGQNWKGLCFKEFPEVKVFEEIRETGSSCKQDLEEGMYRHLYAELKGEPLVDSSCIEKAVSASSTDFDPEESIEQTLYPRPRYPDERTPSYWSSTGQPDVNFPETLTYTLVSPLCVVHDVCIWPFRGRIMGNNSKSVLPSPLPWLAYFQQGQPIYSAMHVRFRLGHAIKTDGDWTTNGKDYVWTYESEKFSMEQVDSMQVFKLPRPILCIGGVLQVEFLGRAQIQEMDQLYYICICHVSVVGRPLFNFKAHLPGDESKNWLEYVGTDGRE